MKRPLAPKFIDNLDTYLLKNKPVTWATRIHLFLYYAAIACIFFAFLSYFLVGDVKLSSTTYIWVGFVGLISFLGAIVWVIYLLRFNVFKRFGFEGKNAGLKNFLIFYVIGIILFFVPLIPLLVETAKTKQSHTNTEIATDYNTINKNLSAIYFSKMPHKWNADTVENIGKAKKITSKNDYVEDEAATTVAVDEVGDYNNSSSTTTYHTLTDSFFKERIALADSIRYINSKTAIIYEVPDFSFLNRFSFENRYPRYYISDDGDKAKPILSNAQLYRFGRDFIGNTDSLNTIVLSLCKKYYAFRNINNNYYDETNTTELNKVRNKYDLYDVEQTMDNLSEKLNRFTNSEQPFYIRYLLYSGLILALFIFIFRHTSTKTYFWSILTAIILLILTSLIGALSNFGETTITIISLSYFLIAAILSYVLSNSNYRKLGGGIAINLFTFFAPFFPLIVYGLLYAIHSNSYDTLSEQYTFMPNFDFGDHFIYFEIAGIVLYTLLMEPVFKKLLKKWYSLPVR